MLTFTSHVVKGGDFKIGGIHNSPGPQFKSNMTLPEKKAFQKKCLETTVYWVTVLLGINTVDGASLDR